MYAVLVVEDDPAAQQLAGAAFATHDDFYVVATVKTADAALAVADVEHVDVVVLDDRLEGPRRGTTIVEELRRLQPHAGIILWTAYPFGPGDHVEVDARVGKDDPLDLVATALRLVA